MIFNKTKTYQITSKIKYLFIKTIAYEMLVKMYVKEDNHRRAVESAESQGMYLTKMWEEIYRLYPKLKNEKCSLNYIEIVSYGRKQYE